MKINYKKRCRDFRKQFLTNNEKGFKVESLVNILGHQNTVICSTIL